MKRLEESFFSDRSTTRADPYFHVHAAFFLRYLSPQQRSHVGFQDRELLTHYLS